MKCTNKLACNCFVKFCYYLGCDLFLLYSYTLYEEKEFYYCLLLRLYYLFVDIVIHHSKNVNNTEYELLFTTQVSNAAVKLAS